MVRVPSYRLHRPSGRAVVTINGKDRYLGVHGSKESKAAYKRLIAEWEAGGRVTSFGIEQQAVTVAMLIADYKEWAKDYHPKVKYDQIRYALDRLADYEDLAVLQFGPLKLRAVQASLVKVTGRHGKQLSRKYINTTIDRVRAMFKWGSANEIVPVTVYQSLMTVEHLKLGRTTAPDLAPVEPVDQSLVEATIEHCSPVVADMIRVQQYCAMRPGEVCNLTPGVIDRTGEVWIANVSEHKNKWRGKARKVFIGPRAQAILRPYLLRSQDAECFSPAEAVEWIKAKRRSERVTPEGQGNSTGTNVVRKPKRKAGNSYTTCTYRRAIWRACEKAFPLRKDATNDEIEKWKDTKRWSPNQLRHSAATLIRKEHGIEAAQIALGHSRADVTQVYAARDEAKAIAVAKAVG